ncbi:MAG: hypothetical protein AAF517_11030 [Planctomycetota bacterium]
MSESDLEDLVAKGQIASVKEGDTIFFSQDAIDEYRSLSDDEPAILLSDDELGGLLEDDDDEIDFGIGAGADDDKTDDLSLEGDGDLGVGDIDLGGDEVDLDLGGDDGGDPEATVVNTDGILDTDMDDGLLEDDDGLGDDTLLDTDVLDLGDETDTFDLDTAEETLIDPVEEGTLLRGGGARVMQMKRKQSHAGWTVGLLIACVLLLLPMSVLLSTVYAEKLASDTLLTGSKQTFSWIENYNYLGSTVDALAGMFK